MRYGLAIGLFVGIVGCGSVDAMMSPDGGGGAGSTGGTGGAMAEAGVDTTVPKPCDATCDTACNTCVSGVCTPKTDDTVCGAPACGGAPLITNGYTANSVGYKYQCRSGTCTKLVNVDCTAFACTTCTQPPSAPGCFDYDDLGNSTGTTECRCVENGHFCPKS